MEITMKSSLVILLCSSLLQCMRVEGAPGVKEYLEEEAQRLQQLAQEVGERATNVTTKGLTTTLKAVKDTVKDMMANVEDWVNQLGEEEEEEGKKETQENDLGIVPHSDLHREILINQQLMKELINISLIAMPLIYNTDKTSQKLKQKLLLPEDHHDCFLHIMHPRKPADSPLVMQPILLPKDTLMHPFTIQILAKFTSIENVQLALSDHEGQEGGNIWNMEFDSVHQSLVWEGIKREEILKSPAWPTEQQIPFVLHIQVSRDSGEVTTQMNRIKELHELDLNHTTKINTSARQIDYFRVTSSADALQIFSINIFKGILEAPYGVSIN
ncbi:unnamed protein product [Darwinula stevensoni]|uniref:Uncharacterized protein n=1 Tax=Darwinula stevensoni TaxID=69355 RepID=A0A7R9A5V5_9CRUS|nr:unnamed protein product [Darwinula stevensoni]CAG0887293.1 unnamed protein product [Darwinula stevensoni]